MLPLWLWVKMVLRLALSGNCGDAINAVSISGRQMPLPNSSWLVARVESYRASGRRIVLRMGVLTFSTPDTSLNRARSSGDILIVAVNSDASVSHLKGSTRPINPLSDRIQVLSGLDCVDHLVPFDETHPPTQSTWFARMSMSGWRLHQRDAA